ncbi:ABC transporter substrate-binding protein [Bengtsoniella intestinalis]|uniref:ABC transporter substrate-binding protein n=1 Tax=Bengtsoniella intestinalis TaxID=3073143 RepID=UPI00391F6DCD
MKKLLALLMALTLSASMVACSSSNDTTTTQAEATEPTQTEETTPEVVEAEPITIKVGVPTAPPALPVLRMMDSGVLGENVTIELEIWSEPETLIAMVQDDSHDMFAFPLTVVSTLYNKGLDVRLMNVNTWGVTYFMTSDPDFTSWADLKGQTVYVPLQTSPPDALTQFFLDEAGLVVGEDVEIVYATTAEVSAFLASGQAVYGTLIEPQVTIAMMKNADLYVAYSFEDEWQRANDTDTMVPNAGFGTTQSFIDENPELTAAFNEAYAEAAQWCLDNPEEIGALAEEYLGMPAAVITASLPNMGLEFKTPQDADYELDMFYQMLFDFEPSMIGGALPDDGMYYAG